jgi:hypothetical protein
MAGDVLYNNVGLLLHGNGTNNSTTITDNSPTGHTVTANGSAVISTATSKYGGASLSFPTTSGYLSVPNHADFMPGTQEWCVEGWFYSAVSSKSIFWGQGTNSSTGMLLWVGNDGCLFRSDGLVDLTYTGTISQGDHIAFERYNSGPYSYKKIFKNGTEVATYTLSDAVTMNLTDSSAVLIGCWPTNTSVGYLGYIDDLRFTYGTNAARYSRGASIPTAAHPDYQAYISGNITESLAITDWRINSTRCADGAYAGSSISSGASYTLYTNTTEACNIHIAPKIDYAWSAGKVVGLGDLCVPSDPESEPSLFEATDIGSSPHQTHATTEPTWPASGDVSDNDITWTFVAALVDPLSLGPKIPS